MSKELKPLKKGMKVWIVWPKDGMPEPKQVTIQEADNRLVGNWYVKMEIEFEGKLDSTVIGRKESEIYRAEKSAVMVAAAKLIKASNDRINKATDLLYRFIDKQ